MSEWWTYRPSDFLMFSASSHARLLERYNAEAWPLHGLTLALGLGLLALAVAPRPRARPWLQLALAAAWCWVGWGFLWSRFAEINAAARYQAWAFLLQAVLLAALAWRAPPAPAWPRTGAALLFAAVLLWPLTAPLTGRSWAQAEWFGLAPEPTALASLGWLLAVPVRHRGALAAIPVASLVLGCAMLWLLYGPA